MRQNTQCRWRLDEIYVKIHGETHYLWRAVGHEAQVEALATKKPEGGGAEG